MACVLYMAAQINCTRNRAAVIFVISCKLVKAEKIRSKEHIVDSCTVFFACRADFVEHILRQLAASDKRFVPNIVGSERKAVFIGRIDVFIKIFCKFFLCRGEILINAGV